MGPCVVVRRDAFPWMELPHPGMCSESSIPSAWHATWGLAGLRTACRTRGMRPPDDLRDALSCFVKFCLGRGRLCVILLFAGVDASIRMLEIFRLSSEQYASARVSDVKKRSTSMLPQDYTTILLPGRIPDPRSNKDLCGGKHSIHPNRPTAVQQKLRSAVD